MISKKLVVLISVGLVGLLGFLYFSPTPHFGSKIPLGSEVPVGGNARALSSTTVSLSPTQCETIAEALKTARGGGPIHACPCIGTIALDYTDGRSKKFSLMPAHRFGRIDLVFEEHCYSMSAHTLFDALEKAGISTKTR